MILKITKKLKNDIRKYSKIRSVAENDPMNLVQLNAEYNTLFTILGPEKFSSLVNDILDSLEWFKPMLELVY